MAFVEGECPTCCFMVDSLEKGVVIVLEKFDRWNVLCQKEVQLILMHSVRDA